MLACRPASPPSTSSRRSAGTRTASTPPTCSAARTARDGKVRNTTVGNLSHLPEPVIDLVRRALRGETLVPAEAALQVLRSRPHGHVAAVLGTLRALGLERLLGARRSRERDLCLALIAARVLAPGSKLATARTLDAGSATSTLGEELGLAAVAAEDLYAAMDWLGQRQARIETALARRHLQAGTLVLYDVSSSYLEGRCCPLGRRGHSRDGKKGKLQIVYGLLCNAEGCPVAVEVYAGNTGDPATLADQIRKVRTRFGLERVVFVGDRGMLTSARINEELRPVEGLDWVSALRSNEIARLAHDRGAAAAVAVRHPRPRRDPPPGLPRRAPGRLPQPAAARRAPAPARGAAGGHRGGPGEDRAGGRAAHPHAPDAGGDPPEGRPGAGAAQDGQATSAGRSSDGSRLRYWRDTERIDAEARLDGIYVIRTSVPGTVLDADAAVRAYKALAAVERALPVPEDRGPPPPPDPPPPERTGPRPRLPVHARLLRRVAHAARLGAASVRRG